jgi:hypothetical protein
MVSTLQFNTPPEKTFLETESLDSPGIVPLEKTLSDKSDFNPFIQHLERHVVMSVFTVVQQL